LPEKTIPKSHCNRKLPGIEIGGGGDRPLSNVGIWLEDADGLTLIQKENRRYNRKKHLYTENGGKEKKETVRQPGEINRSFLKSLTEGRCPSLKTHEERYT